ncbi:MAG: DUF465 domain-containing protein [Pseudomonadota bacterium]
MSIQGRIAELSNRHQALESQIHEEQKRPIADTVHLRSLKREKLRIKEELRTLRKP